MRLESGCNPTERMAGNEAANNWSTSATTTNRTNQAAINRAAVKRRSPSGERRDWRPAELSPIVRESMLS